MGRTPRSADGPLAGLPVWMRLIPLPRAGPGGPAQTRGSAPQFLQNSHNWKNEWHWAISLPHANLENDLKHSENAGGFHPATQRRCGLRILLVSVYYETYRT